MELLTKLTKIGNSKGILIPAYLLKFNNISENSILKISIEVQNEK